MNPLTVHVNQSDIFLLPKACSHLQCVVVLLVELYVDEAQFNFKTSFSRKLKTRKLIIYK